ncbi:MAG: hypothetical protein OEM60_01920 [Gammaproteobacteria bacterium]|nr:hypothetical protein [Gammaproteobacteria bacterium]MDH3429642.1 hypothetical protein [Gammaproteobacteria bacterium]MDH3432592.1 hypothetical protein [Gammaproteobacteria bacterium]
MRVKTGLLVSVTLLAFLTGGPVVAAIGDTQTFSDGGMPVIGQAFDCPEPCLANGWYFGFGELAGVAFDAGEEGTGDHALVHNSGGIGFHFFTYAGYEIFDANFLGNLLEAGVVAVRFRARHSGIGDSIVLRAFLFDTFDDGVGADSVDWAISDGSATIANTGTGTTWQTYEISLRVSDMESGAFVGTPPTVEEILSGVAQFGLRHDPNFTGPGVPAWLLAAVYFDDIQLILDSDADGVADDDDFCADTSIPEAVPSVTLLPNHWALTDDDDPFDFDTVIVGKGPNRSYTVEDTAGCSCEQIIEIQGFNAGHMMYGCSIGVMDHWIDVVNTP